jgi:uncharacterized protein (TIGR02646 family)
MIQIPKRTENEPQKWVDYKNTPGVDYAPHPALRNALLQEQGHICAFCMRPIPLKKRDPGEAEFSKIAHLLSRRNHTDRKFDYDNMVLCCPGNINGDSHCDKSQGYTDITLPLFNPLLQQTITYNSHTGEIKSGNPDWNNEIKNVLKLNNSRLKINRRAVLDGVRQVVEDKKWKKAKIKEQLQLWDSTDKDGKRKPYCGIVIWYLNKKLKDK